MSIHSYRVKSRDNQGNATAYAVGLVGDDPQAPDAFVELGTVGTVEEAVTMVSSLNGGAAPSPVRK